MSYDTGTIYKIICHIDINFVYIGSTFNEIRHRWQCHKKHYKSWLKGKGRKCSCFDYFQKYGIENFSIIKIKEYVCYRSHKLDKKHISAYETLWINKTKRCCNKHPAFQPLLRERTKQYHQDNKEQIKEQRKDHYQNNKEQMNEKKKEKIACDRCGRVVSNRNIPRHKKSNKCISFSNK